MRISHTFASVHYPLLPGLNTNSAIDLCVKVINFVSEQREERVIYLILLFAYHFVLWLSTQHGISQKIPENVGADWPTPQEEHYLAGSWQQEVTQT